MVGAIKELFIQGYDSLEDGEGEGGGEVAPEDRKHLLSTWALIVSDFISFILMHGS